MTIETTPKQSDEMIVQKIESGTYYVAERSKLLRDIKGSSWAYHAIIIADVHTPLTDDDLNYLIEQIVEGQFASSWANRLQAWDEAYKKTHNDTHRLKLYQRDALRRAFG